VNFSLMLDICLRSGPRMLFLGSRLEEGFSMFGKITLTLTQGTDSAQAFSFAESCRCVVGRAEECDIQVSKSLLNVDVSRHHCEFEIDFPTLWVRDLGSSNGTFVNGVLIGKRSSRKKGNDTDPLPQSAWELVDGDEVQVGSNVFRVGIDVAERALVPARSFRPARQTESKADLAVH
jgi:pSer/pThr/pTyr-binding forkhead associated (FHA) protein